MTSSRMHSRVDVRLQLLEPRFAWLELAVPVDRLIDPSKTGFQKRDERASYTFALSRYNVLRR
jgi:hypothetical protein